MIITLNTSDLTPKTVHNNQANLIIKVGYGIRPGIGLEVAKILSTFEAQQPHQKFACARVLAILATAAAAVSGFKPEA